VPVRPILTSFTALMLAAASLGAGPALAQSAPAQQEAAAPAADDPVVANVNGDTIRRSDVLAAQRSLPPQAAQVPFENIYPMLLQQMVNTKLVEQAGREAGLADSPAVKERVARATERAIAEAYMDEVVEGVATEEKLRARYEQLKTETPPREEIRASHILVDDEATAKALIARLEKGEEFAALAKEASRDSSAASGGDLGYFSQEKMVEPFGTAAFALKQGEHTKEPVQTQFGWHVIKLEDRRTAEPPSFEEVRGQLHTEMAREAVGKRVEELREKAKVETFELDGTPSRS
jgi:peptidyl-prolyl cis-trans isomerase C